MGLIAARLILALSVIAAHTAPVLADGSSASNATEPGAFALPAFVPKARQANYATAVNDTNSAVGARRAAEELSAKFADVTTNSISRDEAAAEISPQTAQPAVEADDSRSIVLAANHPDDPKLVTGSLPPPSRPKHVPKSATKGGTLRDSRLPAGGTAENLASIGRKVGLLDLITNPALWH